MNVRSVVAVVSIVVLALAGCGNDEGADTMSESDFVEALADICDDTQSELERIDEPESVADLEDTAAAGIDVLTDTLERLEEIVPPEDVADDFDDFIDNVDDQIDALEDLQQAGADDDEAAANDVGATLNDLAERRSELGEDLGVDECVSDEPEPSDATAPTNSASPPDSTEGPDSTDSAPASTASVPMTAPATVPTTGAPATTAVATTVPATTIPATAIPATTIPATTIPATTTAPATVPVESGPLFNVVDLSTVFVAPDGFLLTGADLGAQAEFVGIVAAVPALNENISEMGVGVLRSTDGTPIATIVVGIAIGDEMPVEWKDILCTNGTLLTSADGYTGIRCPGTVESGVSEIFTLTSGDIGLSIASVQSNVPADLVADAFLAANP